VIFRKISRGPLLPIQVLYGEVSDNVALKKSSSISYPKGKVLMVFNLP
jgi:hypothetical protein